MNKPSNIAIVFFSIVLLLALYIGLNKKLPEEKTVDCKYWNTGYHEFVKVPVTYPEKYHILGYSSYSSDGSRVYHNCNLLPTVDIETFEVIGNGYEDLAKDARHVYYRGDIIEEADPVTYTYMGHWTIGKDKNNIYFETKKLAGVDFDTFEILNSGFELVIIKDKNGTRYINYSGNVYTEKPQTKEFDL